MIVVCSAQILQCVEKLQLCTLCFERSEHTKLNWNVCAHRVAKLEHGIDVSPNQTNIRHKKRVCI